MNRVLLGAALLLLVPLTSAQRLSHDGVFALRGLSFNEGCMMAYRTTRPVNAHAQPSATSPIIRTVDANRRIDLNDFNDGLTSTAHTAIRRVTRSAEPSAYSYGAADYVNRDATPTASPLHLRPGQEIEYVAATGEGEYYVRIDGTVYVMMALHDDADIRRDLRSTYWIRLVPRGGRPAAWVNMSDPGVVETECQGDYIRVD